MFEVYANDRPTGLTYCGLNAVRDASATARALQDLQGRTRYSVRPVR